MKANLYLLPIVVVSLASCAGINNQVKIPVSSQASSPQAESSQTEALSGALNAYRNSNGVSELQRHVGLERLAKEHCEYLQKHRGTFTVYGKNVSHMGDHGRSLYAIRVYGMMNSCENVAWTEKIGSEKQNAERLVTMWSESSDHNWAMTSDAWTHTGVASVVDSDGSVFATQLFCTKNNSLVSRLERYKEY